MKNLRIVAVVACVLCFGALAMAQTVVKASLSGAEENPGVATNASGEAIYLVYADRIEFILTGRGFGTDVNAAHIHLGPRGTNGPVILPLYSKAANGTFTGKISGTLTAVNLGAQPDRGVATFDDAVNALLGGRTYTNIHSTLAAGGEIRGQNLPFVN